MSKHTPGPWTWHPTGLVREKMASVNVIHSHNHTPYVTHEDARLIAAAPEMLLALKDALVLLDAMSANKENSHYRVIGEAIAKAEGKS